MNDVREALVWRVRALALAKRLRADGPWPTSQALADVISAEVEGAPRRRDLIIQLMWSWQQMGELAPMVRSARVG